MVINYVLPGIEENPLLFLLFHIALSILPLWALQKNLQDWR